MDMDSHYPSPSYPIAIPSMEAMLLLLVAFELGKELTIGKKCAFLIHVGSAPNSAHKVAVKCCLDLMNSLQHIGRVVDKQTPELVRKNRLQVKASIDVAKLCALLGIAFRGRDESPDSHNREFFLEILKYTASYNEEVASVVLENAPKNALYTSHSIQKDILSVYASKIQKFIRAEIGDEKFCIIVDESQDESKREQMAIILRFVDKDEFVHERFFDIVHVEDTKAATLKNKISGVLSYHNLSIQSIRGQGYDGASNMRGEWNGLQALFLNECPLLKMFDSVIVVLGEIINDKSATSRAVADKAYDVMMSFELVFVLHFLIDLLGRENDLCRMLQCISQDIVNAIDAISNTKEIIQKFRENGWSGLLEKVRRFCEQRDS
ncbi:uncharacterized protein LOC131009829 [Salvia miltiorrhiza]|uniref:uncharacterized protein LOC131009829 n=1 Tax=Salvia miltiorrhiza TaxID=226208 RepID=UPI0025AC78C0|nr:uncharacterized protein LOC131009829 [Salvia miltiorrhiza]